MRTSLPVTITVALASLSTAGCGGDRLARLEAQATEQKTETDRLARDLADLRRKGVAGGSTAAPPSSDGSREAWAVVRALLARQSAQLPAPGGPIDAPLPGVWRHVSSDGSELALHLSADGGLCGFRRGARAPREKLPFWGRWERHDRLLVELHDRWVGDHNEHDATIHAIDTLASDRMVTKGGTERAFVRVPAGEVAALGSLYDDRIAPIPGLPKWCFSK